MNQITFPTRYIVMIGRTYSNGEPQDYKIVNGLQANTRSCRCAPSASHSNMKRRQSSRPRLFSMTDKPQAVIVGFDTATYFNMMAKLMCEDAPPAEADAPMLAKMAKIGIAQATFDMNKLDPVVQAVIKDLPQTALENIEANRIVGKLVNGWLITGGLGVWHRLHGRALSPHSAGRPTSGGRRLSVHPGRQDRAKLNGANNYTLRFKKDETPPVRVSGRSPCT